MGSTDPIEIQIEGDDFSALQLRRQGVKEKKEKVLVVMMREMRSAEEERKREIDS